MENSIDVQVILVLSVCMGTRNAVSLNLHKESVDLA
jgi:hypothetical protein